MLRHGVLIICGSLLIVSAGCGKKVRPPPPSVTPAALPSTRGTGPDIKEFSATPKTVLPGGSTILRWEVEPSTTSVDIKPGVGEGLPASGQRTVQPGQTTTYTLTATGRDGSSIRRLVVLVPPVGKAREISPLDDYYPCRFTKAQTYEFTFHFGAYKKALEIVKGIASKKGLLKDKERQISEIFATHSVEDAEGIADKLRDVGVLQEQEVPGVVSLLGTVLVPPPASTSTVGCSQSILTWDETRHMFGRAIANNYLAIQINIRNMDPDHEFLLHDVQVAIYDPESGCDDPDDPACEMMFTAGREHVLARALHTTTNWSSTRNVVVSLAAALGQLGVGIGAVAGGPSWRDAFSVYAGTFVPLLQNGVPDFTLQQLKLLDDMAFSSANAYKIVVGKSATVPFVTFLPLKIHVTDSVDEFKHMDHSGLQNLSRRLFALVAGAHISQTNQPVHLTKLACPTKNGALDLSTPGDATGKQFTCDIEGTSLNSVAQIRLRNALESTDQVHVDGSVSVNGGSSTVGKVAFDIAALRNLANTKYAAYLVLPSGQESSTDLSVSIVPAIAKDLLQTGIAISLAKDCQAGENGVCTIELKGSNLGLIADDGVVLKGQDGTAIKARRTNADPGNEKWTLPRAEVAKQEDKKDLTLAITAKTGAAVEALKITVTK